MKFVDPHRHLRRAGDQHRIHIGLLHLEQLRQGLGPQILAAAASHRAHALAGHTALACKIKLPSNGLFLIQRLNHRVPDRPVAGATAQVATELIRDRLPVQLLLPVISLHHRCDKSRSAVTALGARAGHHLLLHGMQPPPIFKTLNRPNLPALQRADQCQAAVHGLRLPALVQNHHRTRPTISLRAAALRPHPAIVPEKGQQILVSAHRRDLHPLPVDPHLVHSANSLLPRLLLTFRSFRSLVSKLLANRPFPAAGDDSRKKRLNNRSARSVSGGSVRLPTEIAPIKK